jgi:hypothetical protein
MFRVFDGGVYTDLLVIALAIPCIAAGIWTMRRGRYLGR